jgi:hypothetical protein
VAFLLQLLLEGVKGMLLRDGEVAESARGRLVGGIGDTWWHGTGTGGLLSISHGNYDEEEGRKRGSDWS